MDSPSPAASVIMVGGPHTGKSHYTFQLYGRLRSKKCDLTLREMPNEQLFREGLERLNKGLAASHTSTEQYDNADLLLADKDGNHFDLLWPDYGGEQVSLILANRSVDDEWRHRLEFARGILLFIRPDSIVDYKNIIDHPIELEKAPESDDEKVATDCRLTLHSQAGLIEMLQLLAWSAKFPRVEKLSQPYLTVLMTCWDELESPAESPNETLRSRLPLLHQYIASNWSEEAFSVFGLSSLGRALDPKNADKDFARLGPASQGYVVDQDGKQTSDLTVVLAETLKQCNAS
ncbi:MAG TPA: hypothetical protein DDW52_06640 [Planctomycetaceae bacterium]|nr:hypothetical protein [Planctomycetaceae bacterium]